jgi:hypothetical protein
MRVEDVNLEQSVKDYVALKEAPGLEGMLKRLRIFWRIRNMSPPDHYRSFCDRVALKPLERDLLDHFTTRAEVLATIVGAEQFARFGQLAIMLSSLSEFGALVKLATSYRGLDTSTLMQKIFDEFAGVARQTKFGEPGLEKWGVKMRRTKPQLAPIDSPLSVVQFEFMNNLRS